jgi:ribosomal protection tetracycline resistance protein
MMNYLIDGYNLIFAAPSLAALMENYPEKARKELLDRLYVFKEQGKHKITVVFDGKLGVFSDEKYPPGIKVIFTKDSTADVQIVRLIESVSNPRELTVVSSDYKDIGHFAEARGVNYLSSQQFLNNLDAFENKNKGTPEKPENVSEEEVNYWLRRFGKRT